MTRNGLASILLTILIAPAIATAQIPQLESNPGARQVLLLDFDGHHQPLNQMICPENSRYRRTLAGNGEEIVTGIIQNIPNAEALVYAIWETVSEDFAPFDVNVTTIEPNPSEYEDDTNQMVRVVLGEYEGSKSLGYAPAAGCWDLSTYEDADIDNVAFVRLSSSANPRSSIIGTRVSHEAGHVYGLRHQEHGPDPHTYAIMGYQERTRRTWVAGKNQHGQWQDDVALLTRLLGLRMDDHRDTIADSTTMVPVENVPALRGPRVYETGVIETPLDEDMFTFRVTEEGPVSIRIYPGRQDGEDELFPIWATANNLIADLVLRDEHNGRTLVGGGTWLQIEALSPNVFAPLPAPGNSSPPPTLSTGGIYRLKVRGRGRYEDIGQYTVVIDGPVSDLSGPRATKIDAGCSLGAQERIRVHFDQAVDYRPSSLISSPPFARLSGPNGAVALTSVVPVPANDPTPTSFDLIFPATGSPDRLSLTIGPQPIAGFGTDPANLPFWMDQNNNGTNGEPIGDDYYRPGRGGPVLRPQPCDLEEFEAMPSRLGGLRLP